MRTIHKYGEHFDKFLLSIPEKARQKTMYVLGILAAFDSVPAKYMKHIRDGLFELRVEWAGNIYRVFFIFDQGNIVVLFNGFAKKTQKTPPAEIDKAMRIRAEYYKEVYG